MLTDQELLERIEAFIVRHKMAPTRFGREAMREASLISSMRNGRSLSLTSANRVLDFMSEYEAGAAASCGKSDDVAAQPSQGSMGEAA